MKTRLAILCLLLASAIFLAACTKTTSSPAATGPTVVPIVSEGQAVLESRCTQCHSLTRVTTTKASLEEWQAIVSRMVKKGAVLTPDEETVLLEYLSANFH